MNYGNGIAWEDSLLSLTNFDEYIEECEEIYKNYDPESDAQDFRELIRELHDEDLSNDEIIDRVDDHIFHKIRKLKELD